MVEALLIDGDGVVLAPREMYFSERLRSDGYAFPPESEKRFFKEVYPDVRLGKRELIAAVEPFLGVWGWSGTAEELLQYWFSHESAVNQEVIDKLQELREKGVKVYLASDHSAYRREDLWERVGLKEYFDGHFFSCDLGVTKADPEYYDKVMSELALQPEEVVFLDDEKENVEVARSKGIKAVLYKSMDQINLK